MGREFELKYRADDAILSALEDRFGPFTAITMETTYYDTADRALGSRRWTLRRRLENGVSVCTVKTPTAGAGRGEWECECGDIHAAIPLLVALGAPALLAELTAGGLRSVAGARFTRLAAPIETPHGTLELALDRGYLLGGGRQLPFCEVEVELKSGADEAAIRFARELTRQYPMTQEPRSKVQRALALAEQ